MNKNRLIQMMRLTLLLTLALGMCGSAMLASGAPSVSVRINPLPTTTIVGSQTVCSGMPEQYGTANAMTSYVWTVVGGNINGSNIGQQVSVTWLASGSITVTYTDGNGCSNSTTQNITVNAAFTRTESVTLCQYDSYVWFGDSIQTSLPGDSIYYYRKQTQYGCDSVYVLNATVLPAPQVTLTYTTTTYQGTMVLSPVTLIASPSHYDKYKFVLNGTTVSDDHNSEVTVQSPLYYKKENQASVQVTNDVNCTNTATVRFVLNVTMPNVFNPNDGTFLKGYDLKIFNRYGHVLYKGAEGWDGKHNSSDMPAGTYFYEIKLQTDANKTETVAGSVRLER